MNKNLSYRLKPFQKVALTVVVKPVSFLFVVGKRSHCKLSMLQKAFCSEPALEMDKDQRIEYLQFVCSALDVG